MIIKLSGAKRQLKNFYDLYTKKLQIGDLRKEGFVV